MTAADSQFIYIAIVYHKEMVEILNEKRESKKSPTLKPIRPEQKTEEPQQEKWKSSGEKRQTQKDPQS